MADGGMRVFLSSMVLIDEATNTLRDQKVRSHDGLSRLRIRDDLADGGQVPRTNPLDEERT
eukprot:jgi/Chrpa1/10551/Chrysochromulina_OHIO_Genome00012427-RA